MTQEPCAVGSAKVESRLDGPKKNEKPEEIPVAGGKNADDTKIDCFKEAKNIKGKCPTR